MSDREQLWYLINGLLKGAYSPSTFCDEFARIYDLETDYGHLSLLERKNFDELSEMASRFSDDAEELKIPNMYFSENEIIEKAKSIKEEVDLKNNFYEDVKSVTFVGTDKCIEDQGIINEIKKEILSVGKSKSNKDICSVIKKKIIDK